MEDPTNVTDVQARLNQLHDELDDINDEQSLLRARTPIKDEPATEPANGTAAPKAAPKAVAPASA